MFCQVLEKPHNPRMTKCLLPIGAAVVALGFSGCRGLMSTAENPTGTGPFDSRGNYVEEWADNPSKWNGRSVPTPTVEEPAPQVASNRTPAPVVQTRPTTSTPSVATVSNPKPKPKPVAKPKPKPKPSSVYHTVRKGDTLYGLAKRYGTSVSVIQRANGISGSTIRIGQKIKIPR